MARDIAAAVRAEYEKHPYPAVTEDTLHRAWRLPSFDWISAVAQPSPNPPRRILVAGCGTGPEAFALQRRFPRAEVVGIDFAARSIRLARRLQKRRAGTRGICFLCADLTSPGLAKTTGGNFDFISCHGVLSYLPRLTVALRNLARCLSAEGVLYLGVNGAAHFSESWRKFLPGFGFEMARWKGGEQVWRHLEFTAQLAGDTRLETLKHGVAYLASDVFGHLIRNWSLQNWVRVCEGAGLHFRSSSVAQLLLRPAINGGTSDLFRPRSRPEVAKLLEALRPGAFHELVFTRRPETVPPWNDARQLWRWRPEPTARLRRSTWRNQRGARVFRIENRRENLCIELRGSTWEAELLRGSDGSRTLREILGRVRPAISPATLRTQLYLFYLLELLNFRPLAAQESSAHPRGSAVAPAKSRPARRRSRRGL